MCEFHLKDNCFHPEKVQRGLVAIPCKVHDCKQCTNKIWQQEKIKEEMAYHNSILKLSKQELPSFNMQKENIDEAKKFSFTRIFG
jgi:hypothetical protein